MARCLMEVARSRAGKPTGHADSHRYVEVSTMSAPINPIRFIAIQSVTFSNTTRSVFLRIDGSNVTQFQGGGSGTVNCQFYPPGTVPVPEIGNLEAFELISIPNVGSAIRSVNFPNAFLRLDGTGVTASQGAGVGTVNCQYYSSGTYPNSQSDWEVFDLLNLLESTPAIEDIQSLKSTAFPQVFLRMDGSTVNGPSGVGSGTVNGQFYPSGEEPNSPTDYETLKIIYL
jgi:hypothetical protein